ncbi:MAG: hypothetical protein HQ517_15465 [SAR324 cluster bacterium]|nr:hypothetical protein [SAR324 cluster bacterium]
MFVQALRKVATELDYLTQYSITLERALDLLETSTQDLEEIVAINTMRESMSELSEIITLRKPLNPEVHFSADIIKKQTAKILYHA